MSLRYDEPFGTIQHHMFEEQVFQRRDGLYRYKEKKNDSQCNHHICCAERCLPYGNPKPCFRNIPNCIENRLYIKYNNILNE